MPTVTPPRRILIAAYYYPPLRMIGARRPHSLAKYLRRRGHDVTVLTSVHNGRGADDGPTRVVRSRDLLATRLNWRRGSRDAITGASDAAWTPGFDGWGALFVPDVQLLSWVPFAVPGALRLARELRPDVVVTTSPTESTHAVGMALRARGVPWIADLRDGWRYEAPRGEWPLAAQRGLDGLFERAALRRADAVVTVSEPLSTDLVRRLGIHAETITNGFDPDDDVAPEPPVPVAPDRLTLVHTGGLGTERTLEPVLVAVARLVTEDPGIRERLEILLAGQQTQRERDLYAAPELDGIVRPLGVIERPESLALQRAADVLLLVTSGVRRGEATGKLFEYLAAGRPIVVLGDDSEAARIVEREGAGLAIPTRDPEAAEALLRRLLTGGMPDPPADAGHGHLWPSLAERYEELVERTIEGPQSRRGGDAPSRSATAAPAR